MLLLHKRIFYMIEFKDVSTKAKKGLDGLNNYSRIISDHDFCALPMTEGLQVINAMLGFQPLTQGFLTFDGEPLTASSASFLRKMMAYVPAPVGFEGVTDEADKQFQMVKEALESGADIILAVNPVSHQRPEVAQNIIASLKQKAEQGAIVVLAVKE